MRFISVIRLCVLDGHVAEIWRCPWVESLNYAADTQAKTKILKAVRVKSVGNDSLHAGIAQQTTTSISMQMSPYSRGCRSDMGFDTKIRKPRASAVATVASRVGRAKSVLEIFPCSSSKTHTPISASLTTIKTFGTNAKGHKLAISIQVVSGMNSVQNSGSTRSTGTKIYSLNPKPQRRPLQELRHPSIVTATVEIETKKTDSGTITFNISPTSIFSLNPSYDVRRTLERREEGDPRSSFAGNITTGPETPVPEEEEAAEDIKWSIAEREHRLSLTPRLNRDLLGMRPTVTSRMSFRENWFREQKNASLNGNISFGVNLRVQKWFGWFLTEKKEEMEEGTDGKQEAGKVGDPNLPTLQPSTQESSTVPKNSGLETSPTLTPTTDDTSERLRENGIDETQIQELEENRGDWIERDKVAVSNQQSAVRKNSSQPAGAASGVKDGILPRILKSFTVNTNANFTATESYRQLASGLSMLEIYSLADDAKERTNSRRGNRYTVRSSVDPWDWASFGTNVSTSDSFRKSSGTTYIQNTNAYEADVKLKARETSSFQIRYSYTTRNNGTLDTILGDSKAHTPSLSWIQTWGKETRTSLGVRTTLRDQLRSGIRSNALIVTPNVSIDYRYHTENGIRVPFFGRIPLKHDLELTNTLSWAIRREQYGANLEERSERYETTLRVGYKVSTHITANFHLGLSYNHDRVEEGRDFLSIATALTVRGEIQ